MLSNSSGLLRYGPETVLTGLERFLPPVWAFNLAGDSRKFASTSHLDFLCACSICRNFGRRNAHFRHKKLPSFFSTDIWAFLIAFWVFIIALVVFVHVPVLLRNNFYILRADLKCAILETGRNITFGALLESLGATNISGFVATALRKLIFSQPRNFSPEMANRARSRRSPCRLVVRSLATSRRGP